jgi:hypothetical protein
MERAMNWLFGRLLEQAVELIDRKLLMVPELEEPPADAVRFRRLPMTEHGGSITASADSLDAVHAEAPGWIYGDGGHAD